MRMLVRLDLTVGTRRYKPYVLDNASVQLHDRHPFRGLGAYLEMQAYRSGRLACRVSNE